MGAALLIMLKNEEADFSWDNARRLMAKPDAFKAQLEGFTGREMGEEAFGRLEPILHDPLFTPEKMAPKSLAAALLTEWVTNVGVFRLAYVQLAPLLKARDEAKDARVLAERELDAVERQLRKLDRELAVLKAR